MCFGNTQILIFPLEGSVCGNFPRSVIREFFFVAVDYTVLQVPLSHFRVFVYRTSKIITG